MKIGVSFFTQTNGIGDSRKAGLDSYSQLIKLIKQISSSRLVEQGSYGGIAFSSA